MLYKIHADYRNNNPVVNYYYVVANSKKEARLLFPCSWLKILSIAECSDDEEKEVLAPKNELHYNIFGD